MYRRAPATERDGGSWTSGGLSTIPDGQTYGSYEFHARIDVGQGTAAAILLWPSDGQWTDEVDIVVQNVSLSELSKSPYKASVTFRKVYYAPGTRVQREQETYVAQVDFTMREHVPNEFVRVNPLGLQITYFRIDQAFEEARR